MMMSAFASFRTWLGCFARPNRPLRKAKAPRLCLEQLEDRLNPSAGPREQYMLELVNRMRENPAAELPILLNSGDPNIAAALSYFHVNLTTLQTQWNTLVAAPALAWNDNLASSALSHDQAMLTAGVQSHQLPGEPDLGTRVSNAGYANWSTAGENIYAYADSIFSAHAAFAIDWGSTSTGIQSPPGHRQNIMSPNFRDIGIAVLDAPSGSSVGPLVITQDFGNRFNYGNAYLVGVVFNDANANGYYDMGEGQGGVTLTVTGTSGSSTYSTTAYGGYQIQLTPGTYSVTASGGGLVAPITQTVTIGASNVHLDFYKNVPPPAPLTLPYSDALAGLSSSWVSRAGSFSAGGAGIQSGSASVNLATLYNLTQGDVSVQADVTLPSAGVHSAGLVARYAGSGDKNMYLGSITASNGVFTAYISRNLYGVWTTLGSAKVTTATGTLNFKVVGGSLKLFLNGQLVVFAYDSTFTAGSVGVRSSPSAGFANFGADAVTLNSATLPFSDDFSSLALGNQLNDNWLARAGAFTGNGAGAMISGAAGVDLATVNGIAQANVYVQADIAIAPTGVHSAGLVARYSGVGDKNMYFGTIVGSSGIYTAYIYRNLNGVWTILASARVTTGTGTLRFEAVGSSLKLFLNGQLVALAYDSALASGTVGLRASTSASFANFQTDAITLANQSLTFSDDFSSLGAGAQLSRAWLEKSGGFTGNVSGQMVSGAGQVSLALVNGISQAPVSVQADVNVTLANSFAGVVTRYTSNGDMYEGIIAKINGVYMAQIYRHYKGIWTLLRSTKVSSGTGTLRFDSVGTTQSLYWNNVLVSSVTDSSLTSGAIGIRTNLQTTFDNFSASAM